MENIYLETQGVKGGETQTKKVGYLRAGLRHAADIITIDDYVGQGKTYKRRELQLIEVIENGELLFSGNKYELFKILRECKQNI